jgi:hypothetical protein
MATAALLPSESAENEVGTPRAAAAWWRRGHTYAFIAMLAVQVSGVWVLTKLTLLAMHFSFGNSVAWLELYTSAMFALLVGQAFLLGLWAALGGLPAIPRWLMVGGVGVAGITSALASLQIVSEEEAFMMLAVASLIGLAIVYTFAVILLPLRRLAGWRVDFDAAYHPPSGIRRGQLHLMDFVALSCAVGIPLALCRILMEFMPEEAQGVPIFVGVLALAATLVCAPPAYAVLAPRRAWFWRLAALAWMLGIAYTQSLVVYLVPDLNVFSGGAGTALGLNLGFAVFLFGIAGSVAAPLLFLRLFGLRLIRVE